jgi:hypothetical protein
MGFGRSIRKGTPRSAADEGVAAALVGKRSL